MKHSRIERNKAQPLFGYALFGIYAMSVFRDFPEKIETEQFGFILGEFAFEGRLGDDTAFDECR